jgi:GNAT superfamily N-acetyltransferase
MRIAFAEDQALAGELRRIINAAYRAGETGLWKPHWERTSLPWLEREIARGEIAVAWRDDRPVGSVRVTLPSPEVGEFGLLAVDPAAHGGGVGRALVRFAEETSAARGAVLMRLDLLVPRAGVHPAKERLHAWYSRLGYRIDGVSDFVALYPEVADLVAVPCDLRSYTKPLRGTATSRQGPGNTRPPRCRP